MIVGILIETDANGEGRTHYLRKPLVKIGRSRSANCEILLDDDSISREHAAIERREDGYLLLDAGSRNGTFVNGIGIFRRCLQDGDLVRLGDATFLFREIEDVVADDSGRAVVTAYPDRTRHQQTDHQTITIPFAASPSPAATQEIETVHSWQILRIFARNSGDNLDNTLRRIADDIGGMEGVRRCILFLQASSVFGKALLLCAPRSTNDGDEVLIPNLDRQGTARDGTISTYPELSSPGADVGSNVRAICLPIFLGTRSSGYLYVAGSSELGATMIRAVHAAADALGIALSIWESGRAFVRRSTMGGQENHGIIGKSRSLQQAVTMAGKAARAESTVLLRGETGTGKELFARLIHQESPRKHGKFFAVNCSVFQDHLLDDALFGHEKGAFTGAVGMKKGYFEALDDGTIFLDEIGELSPDVQAKLLRVLQEGEVIRIGGIEPIHVDVRVIAATHRPLEQLIREGKFREDLYYRLNVIDIQLPALRERREDIPELLRFYVDTYRRQLSTAVREIAPDVLLVLQEYAWPGNIRELRNLVERAMVLADGDVLNLCDLPFRPATGGGNRPQSSDGDPSTDLTLAAKELEYIRQVLHACEGNKSLAAKRLGISRTTLNDKLK